MVLNSSTALVVAYWLQLVTTKLYFVIVIECIVDAPAEDMFVVESMLF